MKAVYNKIITHIGRDNWDRIESGEATKCWEWTGYSHTGYGVLFLEGERIPVHREVCRLIWGDIEQKEVHHICKNRSCVNPFHLCALPGKEHTIADNALKILTHCKHGHEMTEDNLIWENRSNGKIRRRCKACARATQRKASSKYFKNKRRLI